MRALPLVAAAYGVGAYSTYKYHLYNEARLQYEKEPDKASYYKKINEELADSIDEKLNFFENSNNIIRLRRQLLAQARGKTIEPGVGTGRNLNFYRFIEDPTLEVEAVDWSHKMIEEAISKQRSPSKIKFSISDLTSNWGFPDGYFDTVVDTFTFQSIHDREAYMKEVLRVLKPGGFYLFLGRGVPDSFLPIGEFYSFKAFQDLREYGARYDLNFREELIQKYNNELEVVSDNQKHLGLTRVVIFKKK